MAVHRETRQRLLELCYDLLSAPEAAALRQRIEHDPELAQAFREAQGMAEETAAAARLSVPEIHLHRRSRRRASTTSGSRRRSESARTTPGNRTAQWAVGLLSALLLVVSAGGYLYQHGRLADIAAGQMRLIVIGPARLQTGAANTYSVATKSVTGAPLPAQVEIALHSAGNRELLRQKEETDARGQVSLSIPCDLDLSPGARLEIVARHEKHVERIEAAMDVEPPQYETQLCTDRPVYRPGETVFYRSLTLSRFALAADREGSVQFEILDPNDATLRDSAQIGQTNRGIGNGAFRLPDDLPAGRYSLVARSLDKSFPQQRLRFMVLPRAASPSGSTAAQARPARPAVGTATHAGPSPGPGKLRVDFYPEGGELAAGLENRVYFAAEDEHGNPVDVRGTLVNRQGKNVVDVESACAGMGRLTFFAAPDELYRLQLTSPAGVTEGFMLPRVAAAQKVGLRTGKGVFEARGPLEFDILSAEDRLPLVAAAVCRGVPVGQAALIAAKGDNPVSLALLAEVAGVIRLTVYSYASARPDPLAERLVYRKPSRQMQIHVGEHPSRFAPGDKVSLSLTASNEQGDPVAAAFGVSVVDESALRPNSNEPRSLATHFLLASDINRPEDWERADFCLSSDPQAATSLDLLLGTQGWRKFGRAASDSPRRGAGGAVDPPAVFDNLAEICRKYDQSLAAFREQRTGLLRTITAVSFFGGFGLVLLVAMLTLMKIISGIRLWIPALSASLGCLVIGALLMNPDRLHPALGNSVSFTPYSVPLSPAPNAASKGASTLPAVRSPDRAPVVQTPRGADEARPAASTAYAAVQASVQLPAPLPDETGDGQQDKFPLRYYAHHHEPGLFDRVPTVFWHPMLVAGTNGRAQLEFDLPDALTRYRLRADAHGAGRLGTTFDTIVASLPFRVSAKVPAAITVGDVLRLPVVASNDTNQPMPVEVALEHVPPIKVDGSAIRKTELPPGKTCREHFPLQAAAPRASVPLTLRVRTGRQVETLKRQLAIVAPGYPVQAGQSGRLGAEQELLVELPDRWVPNSLEVTLTALPSAQADLQHAVAGLLQSPQACLEQVVALNYLYSLALSQQAEAGVIETPIAGDARNALSGSHARLTPFGSADGGYDWFGGGAGDEVLGALTLFQLRTSAPLSLLSQRWIDSLAAWVDQRRDGKGGFRHVARSGVAPVPPEVADAYITWMLAESGTKGLDAELNHVAALGRESDDPYVVALAAAALRGSALESQRLTLLDKLVKAQHPDGRLEGKVSTITQAGGPSRLVETTALALCAWRDSPSHAAAAQRSADWLMAHRDGSGTFGSTQATMLAVRVLVERARLDHPPVRAGQLTVRLAGPDRSVIGERAIPAGTQQPVVIGGLETRLKPGVNRLAISLSGIARLPYTLGVAYHVDRLPAAASGPVRLATWLSSPTARTGQPVNFSVELTNTTSEELPLTIAQLRLPAGLEVTAEQAAELKRAGHLDWIELQPGQLVCGWRSLAPKRTISFGLRPTAILPGKSTSLPSHAYLAYQPEVECWSEPATIEIGD